MEGPLFREEWKSWYQPLEEVVSPLLPHPPFGHSHVMDCDIGANATLHLAGLP